MRALRIIGIAITCAGCASSTTAFGPELRDAEVAIRSAEALGAADDMGSALYLSLARDELGRAQRQIERGEAAKARSWAMRARTDAELATLLAREMAVRAAALRTFEHARSLADELE